MRSVAEKSERGVGRPPLPLGELRSVKLWVRLTPQEHAEIITAARIMGITVSELTRRSILVQTETARPSR